jgi:hypothetical protein
MRSARATTQTTSSRSAGRTVDAVVTHHLDGFRSGVARFNELLAQELGVPILGLHDLGEQRPLLPLLSFKESELDDESRSLVESYVAGEAPVWEVFLHSFDGSALERRLVEGAARVHCGSSEIAAAVDGLNDAVDVLWTPGLVLDERPFRPSEVSIFSFGMAHKIRTDMFRRLRELLDGSGRSYALYVSAANHETASLKDSQVVFDEMHALFPDELYFLGNLSDVAVYNYLVSTTFYAAFFHGGVRANNTSVASALERGAIVITNLDEHSPLEFVHMETVIDLEQCAELPFDPLVLKRLSANAMELGRSRSWQALATRLTS